MPTDRTAVVVDKELGEVRFYGVPKRVRPKEFKLLCALIDAKGAVLSREQLLDKVWEIDQDIEIDTRTVDQNIVRLRRSIGPKGKDVLVMVREQGYRAVGIEYAVPPKEKHFCSSCAKELKGAIATLNKHKLGSLLVAARA